MKTDDEEPTEQEEREAAALAAALEGEPAPAGDAEAAGLGPDDALETAALLRHAGRPIAVPPAAEPSVAAKVAPLLDARRARGRRGGRRWIATSLALPAAAAGAWLLFATTAGRHAPLSMVAPPPPSADLLAAQAEATRGGRTPGAAIARLDVEMRAYRRRYHEGLRRRLEGEP